MFPFTVGVSHSCVKVGTFHPSQSSQSVHNIYIACDIPPHIRMYLRIIVKGNESTNPAATEHNNNCPDFQLHQGVSIYDVLWRTQSTARRAAHILSFNCSRYFGICCGLKRIGKI